MADQSFFQKFTSIYTDKSINGWVRGIAWIGTAVTIYIVGNGIVKIVNANKSAANSAATAAQLDNEIANKENPTDPNAAAQTPSYSDSQYNNFADAIQTALSGCDFTISITAFGVLSSDGQSIYNVLKNLNNDVDFLKLQKAFGTRTLTKHWYCGYLGDIVNVDLATAMARIINVMELDYFNNYMASKGITYKF